MLAAADDATELVMLDEEFARLLDATLELARLDATLEITADELATLLMIAADDWFTGGFVLLPPPPQAVRKLIKETLMIKELVRIGDLVIVI